MDCLIGVGVIWNLAVLGVIIFIFWKAIRYFTQLSDDVQAIRKKLEEKEEQK